MGRGWIAPDLRSGTSCLRYTASNSRSCTSHLRDPAPSCWVHHSAQLILEYFSVCLLFCKKCSPSRSLCHLHLSVLGVYCIHAASIKHYLNSIKAKQSALNAQKLLGNPASALDPSGSSFGPSSLAPVGIHHLLLSNLTTATKQSVNEGSILLCVQDSRPRIIKQLYRRKGIVLSDFTFPLKL